MTVYTRQGTAPITDGDALDASEIEAEFESIRTVLTNNIDGTNNIKSDAGIVGTQLANGTIAPLQVTSAVMNKGYVETDNTASVLTNTATVWTDVPVFSGVTVTPGSTNDFIFMDFTFSVDIPAVAVNTSAYQFGFSVDGTETNVLLSFKEGAASTLRTRAFHVSWCVQAASTDAIVVKPIYKTSGELIQATLTSNYHVLRAWVLAVK